MTEGFISMNIFIGKIKNKYLLPSVHYNSIILNKNKNREKKRKMPLDPVCKVAVDESSKYRSEYEGITYYFCSFGCKRIFDFSPEKYARKV
jgi:Cu+-exporting ATPase